MRTLLIVIFAIALIAAGTAVYLNWVKVSMASRPDDDKTGVSVVVDKAKVKEDIETLKEKALDIESKAEEKGKDVKEKARQLKESVKDLASQEKVQGTVAEVKTNPDLLRVTSGDATHTFRVAADTQVRIGAREARLSDLRKGDRVTVVYVTKEQEHTARSIAVER
jgi:hypothetical protein